MKISSYPFILRQLTKEEGEGFLIEFPDLPGCMSDGDMLEETLKNGEDAVKCWLAAAKAAGREIPQPGELESQSGKWVQRVPRSMHLRLVQQAKSEGVSLNTLVVSMISEELGKRNQYDMSS